MQFISKALPNMTLQKFDASIFEKFWLKLLKLRGKACKQTPVTRKIGTRLDAYINKINKILAVFFRLK